MFVRVRGRSMVPTLRSGEILWANRHRTLQRGDVVLIEKPSSMLKRIIGLPGETISQKSGRISINGKPLMEPYVPETAFLEPKPDGTWIVGPESYFVLGDARDDSLDSRLFGPVKKVEITGLVTRRLWPLGRTGTIKA